MFNFTCPVCGLPMVHSRLRGYHCHIESHNEEAARARLYPQPAPLTDGEIDAALENAQPVEPSEGFRERALKAMRGAGKRRAVKFNRGNKPQFPTDHAL